MEFSGKTSLHGHSTLYLKRSRHTVQKIAKQKNKKQKILKKSFFWSIYLNIFVRFNFNLAREKLKDAPNGVFGSRKHTWCTGKACCTTGWFAAGHQRQTLAGYLPTGLWRQTQNHSGKLTTIDWWLEVRRCQMVSRRWQSSVQDSTGIHDAVEIPEIQMKLHCSSAALRLSWCKFIFPFKKKKTLSMNMTKNKKKLSPKVFQLA